jgi:hypothetical protein
MDAWTRFRCADFRLSTDCQHANRTPYFLETENSFAKPGLAESLAHDEGWASNTNRSLFGIRNKIKGVNTEVRNQEESGLKHRGS